MSENEKQKTVCDSGFACGDKGFLLGNLRRAKYVFCLFGNAAFSVMNTLAGFRLKNCAVAAYPAAPEPDKIARAEKVVILECVEGETSRTSCPVGVAIEGYTEMTVDFEGKEHSPNIFSSLVGVPHVDFAAKEADGKYKLTIKWCDYAVHEAFVMKLAELLAPSGARVTVTECTYPVKSDICGTDALRRRGAEPSNDVMSACPQYALLANKIKSVCLRLSVDVSDGAKEELLNIIDAVTSKEW